MTDTSRSTQRAKVDGLVVDDAFLVDGHYGVECPHEDHLQYGGDRLLREGSRVCVAVGAPDYDGPWTILQLHCHHCPLDVDAPGAPPAAYHEYDAANVIIADATLAPLTADIAHSPREFKLTDPRLLGSLIDVRA